MLYNLFCDILFTFRTLTSNIKFEGMCRYIILYFRPNELHDFSHKNYLCSNRFLMLYIKKNVFFFNLITKVEKNINPKQNTKLP